MGKHVTKEELASINSGKCKPKKFDVDPDWFYMRYAVDLAPTRVIAEEIGCVNEHVNFIAKKFGIKLRGRLKRTVPYKTLDLPTNEIIRLYVDEKMSCADIGSMFGCTHKPIASRLKDAGIELRHHNDTKRGVAPKNKIDICPNKIRDMYSIEHVSGMDIARHFDVSPRVIYRIMDENGIDRKPVSETWDMRGENAANWKPHLTDEDRADRRINPKSAPWRTAVFERDSYTCQCCGDESGGNLNAHHITPYSANRDIAWEVSNGITLCRECHIGFHRTYGYTKCTATDLNEYIEENKGGAL